MLMLSSAGSVLSLSHLRTSKDQYSIHTVIINPFVNIQAIKNYINNHVIEVYSETYY